MPRVYTSISELVGKTPLLELTNFEAQYDLDARVLVKLEYYNPNQSTKDRIALAMIEDAEKKGLIQPGDTLVETTSGNTGIALAALAATRGYKFRVYIQDQVSEERSQVIRAFGGEVIKFSEEPALVEVMSETDWDFVAVIQALKEKVFAKEDHVFFLDQTSNPANAWSHEKTTGPEIWEDTDGDIDIFVATVGTGGTISGTGKYLKEKDPALQIIAVQPGADSVASAEHPEVEEITGVHQFEGIPLDRVPDTMDLTIYDAVAEVETTEAYVAARAVAKTDGILVGTSSGAAIHVAAQLAKKPENKGKTIVAILPDTGLRYLSTNLFHDDHI